MKMDATLRKAETMRKKGQGRPGGGTLKAPAVSDTMRSSESSVFTVNASGTMRASTTQNDYGDIGKLSSCSLMNPFPRSHRTIRNHATSQ
jgi:hypothetical protein